MCLSVLLVDDEKMPREVLKNYLPWDELQITKVTEAEDGQQALELARLHRPDILISDVKMPRMNGLELAAKVREMYPDCQFVFLSGYTDKEYLKGAIKLKAASYVEKPIDLEELTGVLRDIVAELNTRSLPDPQLLFYRGENGDFSQPSNGKVYKYEKQKFTALGNLIRHKRRHEAQEALAQLYRDIRQCEGTPPEVVRNIYCQIVFLLLAAAESRRITAVSQQGDYLLYTAAKQPTLQLLWKAPGLFCAYGGSSYSVVCQSVGDMHLGFHSISGAGLASRASMANRQAAIASSCVSVVVRKRLL